jgi:hypothetical protein
MIYAATMQMPTDLREGGGFNNNPSESGSKLLVILELNEVLGIWLQMMHRE